MEDFTIAELKESLSIQLQSYLEVDSNPGLILLDVECNTVEDMPITDIIFDVFRGLGIYDRLEELGSKMIISISGKHKTIISKNCYPPNIAIGNAEIDLLRVKEWGRGSSGIMSSLIFSSGRVNKFFVEAPISEIRIEKNAVCEDFQIGLELTSARIELCSIIGTAKKINFASGTINKIFIVQDGVSQQEGEIYLNHLNCPDVEVISNTRSKIGISYSNCLKIHITCFEKCDLLQIARSKCEELTISASSVIFSDISLERIDNFKKLTMVLPSCNVGTMNFLEVNFSKDFNGNIQGATIDQSLAFNRVTNQGGLILAFLTFEKSSLSFYMSLMGKTSFFNCSMPLSWSFESSNIEEISFYSSSPPTKIENFKQTQPWNILFNQQDAFRQLKISSTKKGEKERSNFYRSNELRIQYHSLSWKRGNISEKLAILLNSSNDHGQSWEKPLWILVAVSLIFYLLFIRSVGYVPAFDQKSVKDGLVIWTHYFDFVIPGYLYPTKSKFDFLAELGVKSFSDLHLYSRFLIFLNDILIVPYLTIQMISAFRKHAGKE